MNESTPIPNPNAAPYNPFCKYTSALSFDGEESSKEDILDCFESWDFYGHNKQRTSEDFFTGTNTQSLMEDFEVSEGSFVSKFPGFPSECLAEVYDMNGGDIEGTISWQEQAEFSKDGFEHDAGTSGVAETRYGRDTAVSTEKAANGVPVSNNGHKGGRFGLLGD